MDPVSQGLLGSCLAGAFCKKTQLKTATFCGFVGGLAPDLDIVIRSSSDPLLSIDYHRHFSHSLFFSPIGGLFVSLILLLILRKKLSFKQIYFFSFLGYFFMVSLMPVQAMEPYYFGRSQILELV